MTVCYQIVALYLLTAFLEVEPQYYQNYGQYPYQLNMPYQGAQGYTPYPYMANQAYQPYVSNIPNYYPYNYPVQNSPLYSCNSPQCKSQPSPVGVQYPVNYPGYQANGYSSVPQVPSGSLTDGTDPYANIKTEVIDIDPRYFHYYKRFFNLEDNVHPVQVIEDATPRRTSQVAPHYMVRSQSQQSNYTNQSPKGIHKNEVQTKTFTFKKTFTITPGKNETNHVINLNFLNGVQVTEQPVSIETTPHPQVVTTTRSTNSSLEETEDTTEDEQPASVVNWLG